MKIGIFFGGRSREREISFAGGRTVYDNLDKSLFEPIPVFIDSLGNFILLNWEYIYKGTIRDFYPPMSALPDSPHAFQVYIESLNLDRAELESVLSSVGRRITPEEFSSLFDMAFLALHGPYGEDGNIQGLLEWYGIPYTGAGIFPSALGIDKVIQAKLQEELGLRQLRSHVLKREEWNIAAASEVFENLKKKIGLPLVIKSPSQGSSIGVSIVKNDSLKEFIAAIDRSLFKVRVKADEWKAMDDDGKVSYIRRLVDIREGIGMPLLLDNETIFHPEQLLERLNAHFSSNDSDLLLESPEGESQVLIEEFVKGREFSCIVIQDEQGNPIALPPTEIVKYTDVYDYRSKYLPGISRKVTPIQTERAVVDSIRTACEQLFVTFHFNVYARIDGFLNEDAKILLNDPNTTSGMLPSSFFFHQAAEIGLNPSQFLTFIVRTSLAERKKSGKNLQHVKSLLHNLDRQIADAKKEQRQKTRVAVVMGGFSTERHISVESGRNIYEKLSSSEEYIATPVFLTGDEEKHELFILPIQVMLKDNSDDILEKVRKMEDRHAVTQEIMHRAKDITLKYTTELVEKPIPINYEELAGQVDFVFIALHGRPGEDGAVQAELEKVGLPYNGSDTDSSRVTINKYDTNELLASRAISVARHRLVSVTDWKNDLKGLIRNIESDFNYPFIAKPADDGCSSAVKKIKNAEELRSFCALMFREQDLLDNVHAQVLKLAQNEEFPRKREFLIEDFIGKEGAVHFLEVTGGLVTSYDKSGDIKYEVFEPSEVLASGEVLSLEEKFLAGEGQNITPARFSRNADENSRISQKVRKDLENVAKIMNIQGYARIDAFVRIFEDGRVETIIIEINSLPGMTPATCIFHQSAISHYRPLDFIDAIIRFGKERLKRKKTGHAV